MKCIYALTDSEGIPRYIGQAYFVPGRAREHYMSAWRGAWDQLSPMARWIRSIHAIPQFRVLIQVEDDLALQTETAVIVAARQRFPGMLFNTLPVLS